MWEGTHVGGQFGWVGSDYNIRQITPASQLATRDDNADGAIGGIVYGTSWQYDRWVLGTDSDFSWLDARTGLNIAGNGRAARADTRWTSSTRVRAGHLVNPNLLLYGTLGIAWSRLHLSGSLLANGSESKTLTGFQFGGGIEYTSHNRWFARVEYLRTDYGGKSFAEAGGGTFKTDLETDVVRAAVGYRFDWTVFDLLR